MQKQNPNVPIYIFLGLLESGKTTVIKDFLDTNQFEEDDCNLIIMCEEGEEEISEGLLKKSHSKLLTVESFDDINADFLRRCQKEYKPTSVIIELNGMWNYADFSSVVLPDEWFTFQIIGLVNAETFETYQKNMKDRFVDVFRYAEVIIFNRCDHATRQHDIRRNVRIVNRRAQVIFESELADFVEEEPELPFSLENDPIVIDFDDYGAWYVDLQDHAERYHKRKIKAEGYVCMAKRGGKSYQVFGRMGMACCAEDMTFIGIVSSGKVFSSLNANERVWGEAIGEVIIKRDSAGEVESYQLKIAEFTPKEEPEDTIVYFN
jgi:G3E family GTPase